MPSVTLYAWLLLLVEEKSCGRVGTDEVEEEENEGVVEALDTMDEL